MGEPSRERGWVGATGYFAERGVFNTAGEGEAALVRAASNEWADGLSVSERVLLPDDVVD